MKRGSLDFKPGDTVFITSISDDQPDSFQIEAFVTFVRSGPTDSFLLREFLSQAFPMTRGDYQVGLGDYLGILVCDSGSEDPEWVLVNQKTIIEVKVE